MTVDRISKRTVDALRPKAKDVFLWDTDLSGFGVKLTPAPFGSCCGAPR